MTQKIILAISCLLSSSILFAAEIPNLLIKKSDRRIEVHVGTVITATYPVGLGTNPIGPKQRAGDRATPEGDYYVCGKIPQSQFYKALIVSYPNKQDAERGLKDGVINQAQFDAIVKANDAHRCPPFNTALGGQIEIHGRGAGADWTWGCVALDDGPIEALYGQIPVGTAIKIVR